MTPDEAFIAQHLGDDVRALALKGAPLGVDLRWCMQQIEGWQLARRKIPAWTAIPGIWFPPRLALEQCSSSETASYKRRVVEKLLPADSRNRLVDLTGGLAVDFSALAPLFREAVYVEKQSLLCDLARHNLPLLGLPDAEIHNTDAPSPTLWAQPGTTLFLDPARRDLAGRKTVAIEDCTPNVLHLQPLWEACSLVMVKLSPMLDIAAALRQVRCVEEVHVVSLRGECRELLLAVRPDFEGEPSVHCASIDARGNTSLYTCSAGARKQSPAIAPARIAPGSLLFEPGPSLLKAGCQDAFAVDHGLQKLHPRTHLFVVEDEAIDALAPQGRLFRLERQFDFSKASLRLVRQLGQANLALRNFPGTVDALRRRLHLADGGNKYLFAATLADGSHALLSSVKASAATS